MSDHLPECEAHDPSECIDRGHMPLMEFGGRTSCLTPCVCPALRACTVRVLGEARAEVVRWTTKYGTHNSLWFSAYKVTQDAALAALDRLAQEAR